MLTYLACVAIVLNVLACYMSYGAMYPERRERSNVRLLVMTLAHLLLVAAFVGCAALCYLHAYHVEDTFKVVVGHPDSRRGQSTPPDATQLDRPSSCVRVWWCEYGYQEELARSLGIRTSHWRF